MHGLKQYKDYCIESELSTGDKTLSFLYPLNLAKEIKEEGYIRNKTDEFVIKEVSAQGKWKAIKAKLNVEDLEGKVFEAFDTTNETITDCINLALAGTGWIVGTCDVTKRRTVRKTNSSSWAIIQEAKKVYRCELEFDTLNKKINIYEKRGSDKGVYFLDSLNLKDLNIQSDSYDFYTRIIAKGKDDLKVTLENFQYSKKIKTYIWKDERYTDIESLTEDAEAKLDELSKPYRAYSATVIDLANISKEDYKDILSYSLGDVITLVSKENGIKEKQRIVKMVEYPDEPNRNTCEIANTTLSFEDVQKEFQDTSDTVSNITTDNGTIDGSTINGITTEQIYDFEASVGKITDLTIVNARIDQLYAEKANISELNAVIANVAELNATKANITDLNSINANIQNLIAADATINNALIGKADITELNAVKGTINVLESDTANIKNLLAGNISGESGQLIHLTASNVVIADAVIKDLIASNISVQDLKASTISTNKFSIASTDGGLSIVGPTMQFKDKNNKVRIQMGQDTQGNFNFILRGADGTTTLIDHTGIKEKAIADNLIKENMVAADAIGEKQINYSSLITGLNKDTNTSLIKASKVAIDLTGQSLEVSFNSLKSNVDNMDIGGRNLLLNSKMNYLPTGGSGTTVYKELIEDPNHGTVLHAKCLYIYQANFLKMSSIPIVGEKYLITFFAKSLKSSTFRCVIHSGAIAFSSEAYIKTYDTWGKCTAEITIKNVPDGNPNLYFYPDNDEYWIKDIKIEKGDKATDWTPAPEDVDTKIESNTTAITVAQGKIDALVSENAIIKGDITTISNKYTSLKATVDGINTTVASHTSSIGTINTNISGLSGKVTTVENNYASLSQSLEGFKTTVANNYSTKTELSTVDGKVTGLTSRVSTAESSITQLNNKIALKVEATDITEAINNLQIGGRNLILKKYFSETPFSSAGVVETEYLGKKCFKFNHDSLYNAGGKTNAFPNLTFKENTQYTLQVEWANDNTQGKGMSFIIDYTDGTSSAFMGNYQGNNKFNYNKIITEKGKSVKLIRANYWYGGYTYLSNIKLEEGNQPTDWSPAPEDIDNAINIVDTKITTTNNKVATIETNLSSITQRVSSTESTVSTHTTQLGTVDSRINTAKNSAISTAASDATSKANNAQANAINSAKTYTDGQITTVNKTITNKVAEIKATTDSITSKVEIIESTTTTINGNVTNLQSKVNTVESKITGTAIVNTISSTITGGTGSISTTQFVMDNNGLTIKNGALTIKNKSGTTVFSSDTNGNLIFTGTAKSQSGDQFVSMDSGGINFQDWHKKEQMLRIGTTYFPANRDMNGVNFAMPKYSDCIRFSHIVKEDLSSGWTTSDTQYNFFDCWSSTQTVGSVTYKKGINIYAPMYINNRIKFNYNGSTLYTNDIVPVSWESINGILGIYGDNGAILGYQNGNDLIARIVVTEASHPGTGDHIISWGNYNFNGYTFHNASIAANYLTVSGSKNCLQKTKNYGERLINAYETAEYYFGDLGFGEINEAGECLVYIEDIFLECVNTNAQYHVFTQIYNGSIKTIERYKTYFIVKGEPGTSFSWELKAKRIGYENNRLDTQEIENQDGNKIELFGYEDFKVETSEDTLMNVLTFELEDLLLMEG